MQLHLSCKLHYYVYKYTWNRTEVLVNAKEEEYIC